MWSGTQLLQGAIFAAIFVTSQCQPDSEPGTVGGGTGGATGDQGVVQPPARETTLPPYLFTTLTSYRSTPNKVPDTTRYRHTPGITPRATRMTDIPLITNKPSTIFPPGKTPPQITPRGTTPKDPFVGDGADSILLRSHLPSFIKLTLVTLVCLVIQRLLR